MPAEEEAAEEPEAATEGNLTGAEPASEDAAVEQPRLLFGVIQRSR